MPPTIMSPSTKSDNLKVSSLQHTTVAAVDAVDTGLSKVISVVACLDDDPVDGAMHVTAKLPATGGIVSIRTWKNTDADSTHIAATTFGKKVNIIATGY